MSAGNLKQELHAFDGCATGVEETKSPHAGFLTVYLLLGVGFGVVLTHSEVLSWFRIQEMFHFESFRMFGIIGSALGTAALSLAILKRSWFKALTGEPIVLQRRVLGSGIRYAIGGTLFGIGWALTGACPGPLFALVGTGASVLLVAIFCALVGTWVYGWLKPHLPH